MQRCLVEKSYLPFLHADRARHPILASSLNHHHRSVSLRAEGERHRSCKLPGCPPVTKRRSRRQFSRGVGLVQCYVHRAASIAQESLHPHLGVGFLDLHLHVAIMIPRQLVAQPNHPAFVRLAAHDFQAAQPPPLVVGESGKDTESRQKEILPQKRRKSRRPQMTCPDHRHRQKPQPLKRVNLQGIGHQGPEDGFGKGVRHRHHSVEIGDHREGMAFQEFH